MKKKYMKEILDNYFKNVINDPNTISIVITGSYGRNENDELSDIDWVKIVKNKKDLKELGGKTKYNNIIFDCRIEKYDELKNMDWSMDQYYAYLNCFTYYDKDDLFIQIIKEKKKEWNEYIKKVAAIKLVECSVFLKFPESIPELSVDKTHFEKFFLRKDYYSSYNCLKIIENQLIDLCYVCNAKQVPDVKNRMRNIDRYDFADLLKRTNIILNSKDIEELNILYKSYKELLNEILICFFEKFSYDKPLKWYYYKYRDVIKR